MIRQLLSRYANVPPKRWRFAANAFGRPRIAAPRPAQPLDFNLSHTSEHIVCAVAAVSDVGIDVESRVPDEFLAIARQFFSPSERRWLNDADAQESRDCFLTLWTLKEAYIKALGTGLSTPLDAFSVLPDKNDGALLLDDAPRPSGQRWYFKHWRLAADCRMAIAVRLPEGRAPDVTIRRF
ncbi:MAG: 4'-phosphopantetheinyl transferase superfamily protein [Pseudomonadota bacterium]